MSHLELSLEKPSSPLIRFYLQKEAVDHAEVDCCLEWTQARNGNPLLIVSGRTAHIKIFDVIRGELIQVSKSLAPSKLFGNPTTDARRPRRCKPLSNTLLFTGS